MDAPPGWTEKWALKMNPQYLGARVVCLVLLRDVARDSFDAANRILGTCRHRCRHKRSGSMPGNGLGHARERFRASLHDVAPARSVDVHIHESGNGGLVH